MITTTATADGVIWLTTRDCSHALKMSVDNNEAPSSSCEHAKDDFISHTVSMTDTLAGLALRYGVAVAAIKRANGLATDSALFARTRLLIPQQEGSQEQPQMCAGCQARAAGRGSGGGGSVSGNGGSSISSISGGNVCQEIIGRTDAGLPSSSAREPPADGVAGRAGGNQSSGGPGSERVRRRHQRCGSGADLVLLDAASGAAAAAQAATGYNNGGGMERSGSGSSSFNGAASPSRHALPRHVAAAAGSPGKGLLSRAGSSPRAAGSGSGGALSPARPAIGSPRSLLPLLAAAGAAAGRDPRAPASAPGSPARGVGGACRSSLWQQLSRGALSMGTDNSGGGGRMCRTGSAPSLAADATAAGGAADEAAWASGSGSGSSRTKGCEKRD